jgi:hypothetical protein
VLQGLTVIMGVLILAKSIPGIIYPQKLRFTQKKIMENDFLFRLTALTMVVLSAYILSSSYYDTQKLEGLVIFVSLFWLVEGSLIILHPVFIKNVIENMFNQPDGFIVGISVFMSIIGVVTLIVGLF